jgi:hypothetical protein
MAGEGSPFADLFGNRGAFRAHPCWPVILFGDAGLIPGCHTLLFLRKLLTHGQPLVELKMITLCCLACLLVSCASVKTSLIDPGYISSLTVYKNGSSTLDKADIADCLDITEKTPHYTPNVVFRECLVKRGYMLLS